MNHGDGLNLRYGAPEEVGVSSAQIAKTSERAREWVGGDHHPCLVVLAARRGVIFLHEAYGVLGPEPGSPPVELDTIFPLASLTKPFTAAVAMTLVEEGLLGLNRPVRDYLPEFSGDGRSKILIRHLLTHTSGLREEEFLELARTEHPDKDEESLLRWLFQNLREYVAIAAQTQPHVPPDTVMMYADPNYELLAEVIRRISGSELDDVAKARLFDPMGMKDSHFILPDELYDRVVGRPAGAPFQSLEESWRKSPSATGGLYSTALDTAAYGQMLLNRGIFNGKKVLSPASVRAMTQNQIPGMNAKFVDRVFSNASWGLGWSITAPFKGALYGEQMLSDRSFVHGGAGGVFIWVDPALDILGVYFSVTMRENQRTTKGFADLFINMIVASVEEI